VDELAPAPIASRLDRDPFGLYDTKRGVVADTSSVEAKDAVRISEPLTGSVEPNSEQHLGCVPFGRAQPTVKLPDAFVQDSNSSGGMLQTVDASSGGPPDIRQQSSEVGAAELAKFEALSGEQERGLDSGEVTAGPAEGTAAAAPALGANGEACVTEVVAADLPLASPWPQPSSRQSQVEVAGDVSLSQALGDGDLISVTLHYGGRCKHLKQLAGAVVADIIPLSLRGLEGRMVVVDRHGFEVAKNVPLGDLAQQVGMASTGICSLDLTLQFDSWCTETF